MNKLLANLICLFILKKENRRKFKEKYGFSVIKQKEVRFFNDLTDEQKYNFERELKEAILEFPFLKQYDFMNSFITNYYCGGLTDTLQYFFLCCKINKFCKKKFYFFTKFTSHGNFSLELFNLKKYIDYEIIDTPDKIKIFPQKIINVYKKYGLSTISHKNIGFSVNNKITPPFLIMGFENCLKEENIDEIRDIMQLQVQLNEPNKQKLKEIKQAKNSICLHIRLGDVLENNIYLSPVNYYKKAIKSMREKLGNDITFFTFSNSIDLVKARFNKETMPDVNFNYIDINKDEEAYFELELMKNCQHFIGSQGTFSKLAVLLSDNPNKISIFPTDDDKFNSIKEAKKDWKYKIIKKTTSGRDSVQL